MIIMKNIHTYLYEHVTIVRLKLAINKKLFLHVLIICM